MSEILMRPYQDRSLDGMRDHFLMGYMAGILCGPTGCGKCLARDTPILMFDGTIKPVQHIRVGHLLMGPDSKPRKVLSLANGMETMYKVTPVKGDSYTVNESHILSLRITGTTDTVYCGGNSYKAGDIANVSILDYLAANKTFKHVAKGWRVGVDFERSGSLPIDPYFLGVWLGDGDSRGISITTGDIEIEEFVYDYAALNEQKIIKRYNSPGSNILDVIGQKATGRGGNKFKGKFHALNIFNNKHIPLCYKTASKKDRLALLAGLIDTDGHYTRGSYSIIQKNETIIDDIIYLCRSLGFSAYKSKVSKTCHNNGAKGFYFSCSINGNLEQVPCLVERKKAQIRKQKKNVLRTGITVKKQEFGEYFGFTIDGDSLFLLGDFTVTHNTRMFCKMARNCLDNKITNRVLILTNRIELLSQAGGALSDVGIIPEEITATNKKINRRARCYVGMVETYFNRLKLMPDLADFTLIIIDECHYGNFKKLFKKWRELNCKARIVGVTATPLSSKKNDPLSKYYDFIVNEVQISELVRDGFLSTCKTYCAKETQEFIDRDKLKVKGGDFSEQSQFQEFNKRQVYEGTLRLYQENCERYNAGRALKTICFNVNIEHSLQVRDMFRRAGYRTVHIDSEHDKFSVINDRGEEEFWDRKQVIAGYKAGRFDIICNVGILNAGFDDAETQCIIINLATTSVQKWLQCCGRGSRISPGKLQFIVMDMGANWTELGLWETDRDWDRLWLGSKRKKKLGAAPVKKCPECGYLLPLSAKRCSECGYVYPEKERDLSTTEEFVEIKGISPHAFTEQEKKEIVSFDYPDLVGTVSVEMLERIRLYRNRKLEWPIHVMKHASKDGDEFMGKLVELGKIRGYNAQSWAYVKYGKYWHE